MTETPEAELQPEAGGGGNRQKPPGGVITSFAPDDPQKRKYQRLREEHARLMAILRQARR